MGGGRRAEESRYSLVNELTLEVCCPQLTPYYTGPQA